MIGSIGYHLIPGRTPLLGGWSLGINQHSSNKEEAFQFLKWTCEEQTANYTTLLGGLTVLTNTYVMMNYQICIHGCRYITLFINIRNQLFRQSC